MSPSRRPSGRGWIREERPGGERERNERDNRRRREVWPWRESGEADRREARSREKEGFRRSMSVSRGWRRRGGSTGPS